MTCEKKCDCGNEGHEQQDIAEFTMIAANLGWTAEHSNLLIEFEKENDEVDGTHYFAKEMHCAHLRGYLHASEQTESKILEWKNRLEGWSQGKGARMRVRETSIGPKTQVLNNKGKVIGEQG